MTTITKERIELFIKSPLENGLTRGEQMELARIALASLEAEPIGAFHIADQQVDGTSDYIKDGEWPIDNGVIEVYAAPPVLERERIRREHAEWSDKTFGDVGPIGPLKHLSKEALEAAADPSDPLEWADMQFLLWDAQRRMGISDEFITRAMIEKLAINKARQWPEPKDGEPRLHIKAQPVSVVPDGYALVPVEPTDEMIAAAMECDDVVFDSKDPTAFCVQYREIYCAMVDTVPALNKGEY